MPKDRGCKAFPYRLTCNGHVSWHECVESANKLQEREGLKNCVIEKWKEDGEYEEVKW